MITGEIFKNTPSRYIRRVMTAWIGRWWWAFCLPLAILALLSAGDVRYLIVAMMCVFILYPGVMMLVYFKYGFTELARRSIIEQQAQVGNAAIHIIYIGNDEMPKLEPMTVEFADVRRVEDTGKSWILWLKGERYAFIELPVSAFAENDRKAVQQILQPLIH